MTSEIYMPSASADKNNAFYLDKCVCVEHRPAYAACLSKIEARKSGKLSSIFSVCSNAIARSECVALGMREKELLQGRAVYFVSRKALQEAIASSEALPMQPVFYSPPTRKTGRGSGQGQKSAPEPIQRAADTIAMPSYADAINAAIREESARKPAAAPTAPQNKPVQAALVTMLPGETVRDYAARVAALKKEKATHE